MFTHYRTQGFILKKVDRGEFDRIFTVYTKDFGKLELLAKAVRKIKSKLRGGLELFYLSDIEFIQAKTHKTLTDAILINDFKALRKDSEKLSIAFEISENLDNLITGQEPDEKIWQLLDETFTKLNDCQSSIVNCQLLYHYFLWNLFSMLGYQPELYCCSVCQKEIFPESIYFSLEEGGLICGRCQKSAKSGTLVHPNAIKILRIILKGDWQTLKKLKVETDDLKQLMRISNVYLSGVLRQIR